MPNQNENGNGFPSMSDLLFFKSMNALTPSQVKMYYDGNAINAQQAVQLGYTPTNMMKQTGVGSNTVTQQPKQTPQSNSNHNPSVNPQVNPNANPAK